MAAKVAVADSSWFPLKWIIVIRIEERSGAAGTALLADGRERKLRQCP
jgi:hypothetical protein